MWDGPGLPDEQREGAEREQQGAGFSRRRRHITQAGMAVPVVLALQHRSLRAAWQCDSPSGFTSLNVSNLNRPYTCHGRSPGYYHKPENYTGISASERFYGMNTFHLIPSNPHFRVPDPKSLTLVEVVNLDGAQDPQQMGAYFVAALLNAINHLTDPINVALVREMWRQYATQGYFTPPPGADQWYADDIKRYLETTWA